MDFCLLLKTLGKNLSNKCCQKLIDTAERSTTDAIKTASKRVIQKTAEATGDLIGNKIADKITSVSNEKPVKELSNDDDDDDDDDDDETEEEDMKRTTHKKGYISPEKRQQIIDELGLVPKN